jgi:hypothetical protein
MRDGIRGVVIGLVLVAAFYGLMVVRSMVFDRIANAAVESVVPPVQAHEQLEIETPVPAAPEEVTVPAVTEEPVDFDKVTRQRRVLAYSAGLLCEAMANATSGYTPGSAFSKSFLKQFGVQMQVAVLTDADLISHDPAVSFAQGFLIGL